LDSKIKHSKCFKVEKQQWKDNGRNKYLYQSNDQKVIWYRNNTSSFGFGAHGLCCHILALLLFLKHTDTREKICFR
jgi:hypothetical protein